MAQLLDRTALSAPMRRPRFVLTSGGTFAPAPTQVPMAAGATRSAPSASMGSTPPVIAGPPPPPPTSAPGAGPTGTSSPADYTPPNFFEKSGRLLTGDLINRGGQAGAFSPYFLRDSLRAGALRNADAQRRRMQIFSHLLGLDPAQQQTAMMDAENNANAGVAGSLNDAESQGLQSYRDFIMSLLGGERNMAEQRAIADKQRKAANSSAWGSLAGSLGSAAIGKL